MVLLPLWRDSPRKCPLVVHVTFVFVLFLTILPFLIYLIWGCPYKPHRYWWSSMQQISYKENNSFQFQKKIKSNPHDYSISGKSLETKIFWIFMHTHRHTHTTHTHIYIYIERERERRGTGIVCVLCCIYIYMYICIYIDYVIWQVFLSTVPVGSLLAVSLYLHTFHI